MVTGSGAKITVALPLYRSRGVAWLALESLARQRHPGVEWELVVAEEGEDCLGEKALRRYEGRLAEQGCVRVSYRRLDGWVALSQKWRLLAGMSGEGSELFVLKAGDCYSYPERLWQTARQFEDPTVDWVQTPKGYFYDVGRGQMSLYDYELTPPLTEVTEGWERHPCGLNMALRTHYVRGLPDENLKRGVDLWLFWEMQRRKGAKATVGWIREDGWERGVDTHGLNNISQRRSGQLANHRPPFRETNAVIEDVLPADVVKRLDEMRFAALERSCQGLIHLGDENAEEIEMLKAKVENFRGMIKRRDEKIEKLEVKLAEARRRGLLRRLLYREKGASSPDHPC